MNFRGKKLFWIITILVAAFDLATKHWAFAAVSDRGRPSTLHGGQLAITIVDGFFYLTKVWNPGGIWGIAQTGLGSKALVVFRVIAVPGIIIFAAKVSSSDRRLLMALSLFCAGAIGNLYGNLAFDGRGVRDFLDFFLVGENGYHYPTFNVADAAIVCAAGLLIFDTLFSKPANPSPSASSPAV